jgi:hypothetical protein
MPVSPNPKAFGQVSDSGLPTLAEPMEPDRIRFTPPVQERLKPGRAHALAALCGHSQGAAYSGCTRDRDGDGLVWEARGESVIDQLENRLVRIPEIVREVRQQANVDAFN